MEASFVLVDKGENSLTGLVVNRLREGVLPPSLTDPGENPAPIPQRSMIVLTEALVMAQTLIYFRCGGLRLYSHEPEGPVL